MAYRSFGYIGVAIDLRPRRQIQNHNGTESNIQEVVLINERLQAILLRMWDNFVEHECIEISNLLTKRPIIVGKHLRVTSFNVIGEAVEKFFDCCAEELMHQDTMEDRPNNVPVFRTHIEDEHVVYVKSANRATIPNQTLFDVIFILDPVTVIKETKALEFPSTNKQSSSLFISTIPREEESDNSSVRRVLFGASSDPQEKKKQKQEESMYRDDEVTTFDSDDVDKNNYNFSDGTSSASK
ncbi:replication protein A 70 kDa DNA-binding subunit B-like [Abeliophyllum distichum]|uniref:Replication protein A 70 kDa DNA-binding subunit B-like n=1 Tax=Abeliophyllum distichum TaxID=126358 RepID=A0ABD1QV67_9LAMI